MDSGGSALLESESNMKRLICPWFACWGWLAVLPVVAQAQQKGADELPKALFLGGEPSSTEAVRALLEGRVEVVHPEGAAVGASGLLEHLGAWLEATRPAVVYLQASDAEEGELGRLLARLKQESGVGAIVSVDWAEALRGGKGKVSAAVAGAARAAGVPLLDLPSLFGEGTGPTSGGRDAVAAAVADALSRQAIVSRFSSAPPTPETKTAEQLREERAEAGRRYREQEAEQDALVPEMFRNLPVGVFDEPESAEAWERQRPEVLAIVKQSLGDLPPRPSETKAKVVSRERRDGYTLERVSIDNGVGNDISALVLIPDRREPRAPAILWLHSSTPDKNAVLMPDGGGRESLGEVLARRGYVVLAPDAWYYGDRAGNVPSGPRDVYRRGVPPHANLAQDTLLKLNLWLGRTQWGMMVRDDQIALDYLSQRPEVDPGRIGATGMSMGSTRSWWLAAVDERVAATVGVACLTRYGNLIRHGTLRAHGLYYFTYGLLKHFDTEGVISLIAPRPYLALTGDLDYGSPVDGIREIEASVGRVYRTLGAEEAFKSIVYEDIGHVYTPEMREEMLAWFERWLKADAVR